MNRLFIKETNVSPEIDLNSDTGILKIRGVSYPENAVFFYTPVFTWLEEFIKSSNDKVIIEIEISYLNTSSTRCLMKILEILDQGHKDGKNITLNWYYDKENDQLKECAEEFKEDLLVEFNIIPI